MLAGHVSSLVERRYRPEELLSMPVVLLVQEACELATPAGLVWWLEQVDWPWSAGAQWSQVGWL
eukprot:COSAG02_NODE_6758_length_3380_cov_1.427918_2_plen_64_part_00